MFFQLREDIAKLERLDRETLFLAREGISSMEQLIDHKGRTEDKIESLTVQRQELRKELRRLTRKGNQSVADEVRGQIGQLSQRLKRLRKELSLCDSIALRSGRVKNNLGLLLVQEAFDRKTRTPQKRNRNYNIGR